MDYSEDQSANLGTAYAGVAIVKLARAEQLLFELAEAASDE